MAPGDLKDGTGFDTSRPKGVGSYTDESGPLVIARDAAAVLRRHDAEDVSLGAPEGQSGLAYGRADQAPGPLQTRIQVGARRDVRGRSSRRRLSRQLFLEHQPAHVREGERAVEVAARAADGRWPAARRQRGNLGAR